MNKVRFYREKSGMTQEEMARLLGLTKGAYALKEQERRSFSIDEAKMITKIFRKPFEIIF
jgi:DNA-binding XRE family transcriptional regulator